MLILQWKPLGNQEQDSGRPKVERVFLLLKGPLISTFKMWMDCYTLYELQWKQSLVELSVTVIS